MLATTNARRHFPYDCLRGRDWEEEVLSELRQASNEDGVRGIFLLVAAPQGYIFQHLVVCQGEFGAEGAVWCNLTNKTEAWSIKFIHDPVRSLHLLSDHWRDRNVSDGVHRDPARGRDVTLLIAARGGGGWIRCQTPVLNATEDDDLDALILDLQRIPTLPTKDAMRQSQGP
jgi:hypothetical protein